jgi:hypothetical protein
MQSVKKVERGVSIEPRDLEPVYVGGKQDLMVR